MGCPICTNPMHFSFNAFVLDKYEALYEVCKNCGYLRCHSPHWLEEAYGDAIANADTGLVVRNLKTSLKLAGVLYWVFNERGRGNYLDAAGGYGVLTRLMRDLGFNFYWSDKYCANLMAKGFEYSNSLGPCYVVTAMEVLEHVIDPLGFIQDVMAFSGAEILIFSTVLYKGKVPDPKVWWYYSFPTGQHIGFFQARTLKVLGDKLGMHFTTANGVHVLSKQKISPIKLFLSSCYASMLLSPLLARSSLGSKTKSDHELLINEHALLKGSTK